MLFRSDALKRLRGDDVGGLVDALLDQVQTLNASVFPDDTPRSDGDTPRGDALRRLAAIGTGRGDVAELRREVAELRRTSVGDDAEAVATRDASDPERDRALVRSLRRQLAQPVRGRSVVVGARARRARHTLGKFAQDVWQPGWLSVLSCGSVCRSCVTVIARPASTHTALVSQSLVGLCFADRKSVV